MDKPILCIDFDGVIHSYEHGWQDGAIYGVATRGFFEWAQEAQKLFKLVIYSSRSKTDEGVIAMSLWMRAQLQNWRDAGGMRNNEPLEFEYADKKPPAFLTIDDRAICFQGDWNSLHPGALRLFRPWNVPASRAHAE